MNTTERIQVPAVKVTAIRDAIGAHCATCDQTFDVTTCPYWHWSKSVWMHKQGTGHKVTMYRFA